MFPMSFLSMLQRLNFITFHVLLNYVSPIIKFEDLHKACQTSRGGGANAQLPPSGCATVFTVFTVFTV